jgi:hypothetical protein
MARKRTQTVAAAMVTMLIMFTTSAARRSAAVAGPVLSVSPTTVAFPLTPVGGFSYEIVTITNTGDAPDFLTTATPGEPPLYATFGGTCNLSIDPNTQKNYYIPAGSSCTFQWAFNPSRAGRQAATGTLIFESGATLTVLLTGRALPH